MTFLPRLAVIVGMLTVLLGLSVRAADEPASQDLRLSVGLEFASAYVWRGLPYNNDAQFKPSLTLGYQAWELAIMGYVDTTDSIGREDNFAEVDYTLSYRHELSPHLALTGGAIYYDYPGTGFDSDLEVFLALAALCPARPVLAVYYDVRNVDGFYVNFALSHELALPRVHEGLYLILAADLGWASDNFAQNTLGVADAAWVAISPGATLEYRASERLSFAWYARYDHLLENAVREQTEANGNDPDNFTFGARASLAF